MALASHHHADSNQRRYSLLLSARVQATPSGRGYRCPAGVLAGAAARRCAQDQAAQRYQRIPRATSAYRASACICWVALRVTQKVPPR
jgi:hypothetical protein